MKTWETLTMSRKEVVRPGLIKALVTGQFRNRQVAAGLHLSVRQVQRLTRRFRADGVAGLVHRTRGQPSRCRLASAVRSAPDRGRRDGASRSATVADGARGRPRGPPGPGAGRRGGRRRRWATAGRWSRPPVAPPRPPRIRRAHCVTGPGRPHAARVRDRGVGAPAVAGGCA
jgi:Helix-turn-helix domain